jgi:hypothetical protein
MPLKLQMEQCPVVMVTTQIHVTATSAVTTVRTAVRVVLDVAQMHGATAALS